MKKRNLIGIFLIVFFGLFLVFNTNCKKENDVNDCDCPTTVTDTDGNVYNTVAIGNQCWMAENLKVTHYRDGTQIPNVTDSIAWSILTTGAYCNYDNTPGNNTIYAKLYNWYAVSTGNLAPTGWHVPTDAEWTTLTSYLGDESVVGGKLKETGTNHWQSPNTGASNESGFAALPGGYRNYDGIFYAIGNDGHWWSSTEYSTSNACSRRMKYNHSAVFTINLNKDDGLSVRCVRD